MANLDHTILFYILNRLKGRVIGKNNKDTGRDLLIINRVTLTQFVNGTASGDVYWLDGDPSNINRWRNQIIPLHEGTYLSEKELEAKFKMLDTRENVATQMFPNRNALDIFTFSSHAYNVLLRYMKEYNNSSSPESVQSAIIGFLKEKDVDDSCFEVIYSHNTFEGIAKYIIEEVRHTSSLAGTEAQIRIAAKRQVKTSTLPELQAVGVRTSVIANALSSIWPLPVPKATLKNNDERDFKRKQWMRFLADFGSDYFGFLYVPSPAKIVGFWFCLPVASNQITDIFSGSFVEKSYEEGYCYPNFFDDDCNLYIVNIGLSKEFIAEKNINLLLDSFASKLKDFSEKKSLLQSYLH